MAHYFNPSTREAETNLVYKASSRRVKAVTQRVNTQEVEAGGLPRFQVYSEVCVCLFLMLTDNVCAVPAEAREDF